MHFHYYNCAVTACHVSAGSDSATRQQLQRKSRSDCFITIFSQD